MSTEQPYEVGDRVYKRVGSALAEVVAVDGRSITIEFKYTVGRCTAGERQTLDANALTISRRKADQ
jgi:hypothetical protein